MTKVINAGEIIQVAGASEASEAGETCEISERDVEADMHATLADLVVRATQLHE